MSEWGDKLLTEADNARLRAENAKLRERVHELEIEYDGATTAVLEKTERIEWIAGRLRGETNENEKLRERVAELEELTDGKLYIPQEWYQLVTTENAKLRELLADLAVCACGKYCYGCPHQYDGCDRDERIRELIGGEDA